MQEEHPERQKEKQESPEREEHLEVDKSAEAPEKYDHIEDEIEADESDDLVTEEEEAPEEEEPIGIEDQGDQAESKIESVESDDYMIEDKAPPSRKGCVIGCLIPVFLIIAGLVIAIILGYSRQESILKSVIDNTYNNLPEDMREPQNASTFEEVKTALESERIDTEILIEIMEEYQDSIRGNPPELEKKQAAEKLIANLGELIRGDD